MSECAKLGMSVEGRRGEGNEVATITSTDYYIIMCQQLSQRSRLLFSIFPFACKPEITHTKLISFQLWYSHVQLCVCAHAGFTCGCFVICIPYAWCIKAHSVTFHLLFVHVHVVTNIVVLGLVTMVICPIDNKSGVL